MAFYILSKPAYAHQKQMVNPRSPFKTFPRKSFQK